MKFAMLTSEAIPGEVIVLRPQALPSEEHNETSRALDHPIANSQTTERNVLPSMKADSPCLSWFLLQCRCPNAHSPSRVSLMKAKHNISRRARSCLGPIARFVRKEYGVTNYILVSGDEPL
jgi:hypothetical protein